MHGIQGPVVHPPLSERRFLFCAAFGSVFLRENRRVLRSPTVESVWFCWWTSNLAAMDLCVQVSMHFYAFLGSMCSLCLRKRHLCQVCKHFYFTPFVYTCCCVYRVLYVKGATKAVVTCAKKFLCIKALRGHVSLIKMRLKDSRCIKVCLCKRQELRKRM